MRGQWHLRDWELDLWKRKIEHYILYLERKKEDIDLSEENINPYQVREVLETLGWEHTDSDSNGWEQDHWMYFRHPNHKITLTVFSSGMTFELKLYISDEEE